MEDVIIDFVANTEGLKPVIQYLNQIGQITDEQVKDFDKMNKLYSERSKRIAEERTQIKGASRDMSDLAKSAQDVNKALTGKAMEEATKKMVEHGKEIDNVAKKYTSAKQELKELTKLITSNQLSGEQLKAAKERAAELTDQISDARHEIAAMASDTRKFDLLVEGIRGVTSAFSAVTSAQALFGEENEDVQKALLKVQAAMALATSAQELANIATTKGGIATTAYGYAITAVEAIQKRFAVSSAAAWAIATGGVTLLIAGVASLIYYFKQASDASEDLKEAELSRKQLQELEDKKEDTDRKNKLQALDNEYKKRIQNAKSEVEALAIQIEYETELKKKLQERVDGLKPAAEAVRSQFGEQNAQYIELQRLIIETEQKIIESDSNLQSLRESWGKAFGDLQKQQIDEMRATDAALEQVLFDTEDKLKRFKDTYIKTGEELDEPLVPDGAVEQNKENLQQMNYDIEEEYRKAKKLADERKAFQDQTINQVANFAFDSTSAIFSSLYDSMNQLAQEQLNKELTALEQRKSMELSNKNLTEQQKAAIEAKYRKQEGEAKRKAWKAEQDAKAEQAIINGFLAFTQSLATQGYPAGLITGALALATAGIQSALILSKPVPEFAKGTKGSQVTPPGFKLVGEQGPELIYEPGGAKVITAPDTAKILAAYQIPAVPDVSALKGAMAIGAAMPAGIDYQMLGDVIAEKLRNNPQTKITIDKTGFSTHIITKNRSVNILNNDYSI